jgi:hypothetical protein
MVLRVSFPNERRTAARHNALSFFEICVKFLDMPRNRHDIEFLSTVFAVAHFHLMLRFHMSTKKASSMEFSIAIGTDMLWLCVKYFVSMKEVLVSVHLAAHLTGKVYVRYVSLREMRFYRYLKFSYLYVNLSRGSPCEFSTERAS